ncbi:MAG: response regulator [Candidatus Omnitrophota bacterium]
MNKKILIVDDEKDVTLVLKEFFVSRGYEVLTAFNGREAMVFLKQPGIDLILLDMQMPDISGIEILREAKRIYRDAKIVVLTGFSEDYKEEAEKLGCDAFLTKPFSMKTLIKVVESVLGGGEEGGKKMPSLIDDDSVLAKARLLFIEPNEIIYSSKLAYFRDAVRCRGRYQLTAAFTETQTREKLDEFRPDIILSDISVFRLYKLNDKIAKAQNPPKDIILYGLFTGARELTKDRHVSFIGGFFDPVTAIVRPEEMDKLGRIVRSAAIAHDLYVKVQA